MCNRDSDDSLPMCDGSTPPARLATAEPDHVHWRLPDRGPAAVHDGACTWQAGCCAWFDARGVITDWDRAGCLLGRNRCDTVGRRMVELFPGASAWLSTLQAERGGPAVIATVHGAAARHRDGHAELVDMVISVTSAGDPATFCAYVRGASPRLHIEQQARSFRSLIGTSPDALLVTDTDGRLLHWGPGAERMYGYTPAQMIGRKAEVLVPDDRRREVARIRHALRSGERIEDFETVHLRGDGSRIRVSLSAAAHTDSAGRVYQIDAIVRDISAARIIERQMYATADKLGVELDRLKSHAFSTALPAAGGGSSLRAGTPAPADAGGGRRGMPVRQRLGCAVSALSAQIEQLHHLALHDPLTGIANRTMLYDRLSETLLSGDQVPRSAELLMIDLDEFKFINDTLGHAAGDDILREFARRITDCADDGCTVARTGGDEFAILAPNSLPADAQILASRIGAALEVPFTTGGHDLVITASIGIATARPGRSATVDEVLRCADTAMYAAKADGKGRARHFEQAMHATQTERLNIETALRRALPTGQLRVAYQPIFDAATARPTGAEALLRWTHPSLGTISPAQFIPAAERTGSILPIGAWVIDQASRIAAQLNTAGHPLTIAVNISPRQLLDDLALRTIVANIDAMRLPPHLLTLEITESTIIRLGELALQQLRELRRLGLNIAIDDFGTGGSSLSRLQELPVNILKIDKSFIDRAIEGERGRGIVDAVIAMAHRLEMEVVAEGVETEQQRELLQKLGCDAIQGFLLGKPASDENLRRIARRHRPHTAGAAQTRTARASVKPVGAQASAAGAPAGIRRPNQPRPRPGRTEPIGTAAADGPTTRRRAVDHETAGADEHSER